MLDLQTTDGWRGLMARLTLVGFDLLLLPLSLLVALPITSFSVTALPVWAYLIVPALAVPIFLRSGLYRAVVRFIGVEAILKIVISVLAVTVATTAAFWALGYPLAWNTVLVFSGAMLMIVGGSRLLARHYVSVRRSRSGELSRVVIYGSGSAGVQIARGLQAGDEYIPVCFVDDEPYAQKKVLLGLKVYGPADLPQLLNTHKVDQILLAIPSASRSRRREVLASLHGLPVDVRILPGMADLVSGQVTIKEVRDVGIEDLLGRDTVPPKEELLLSSIQGHTVMVTGAGGSIGSELCRQIIKRAPARLVLFECCEFALYSIERDLRESASEHGVEVMAVMGSVVDRRRLDNTMRAMAVDTVYHAAAYKHVPLVEANAVEGARNNILGTLETALAAEAAGVETFVLVSTDKAVRPTNIMGATKRVSEMVLQGITDRGSKTRFCMVRFGNVMNSSGSVIPLFRKQIEAGGPVTVTHPEVTRYFMTIPEAAALVLQAGTMGTGGDVFVLDMGEPVRIVDMAERMINLAGLQIRDENNPDGDIEVRCVGLRPGEKLYEELLIGDNAEGTDHPLIMSAHEEFLRWAEFTPKLQQLSKACIGHDSEQVRSLLKQLVKDYSPDTSATDVISSKVIAFNKDEQPELHYELRPGERMQ